MKPLKVEFQAFGPYPEYECVDFNLISSKGLFLICGKTGTGKTMILDAMTFALFGKSSGSGRDDFSSMRCTNADEERPTFVKLLFENNGRTYLFERRLEKKRKNFSASYNAGIYDENGEFQPFFENPKEKMLNEKAEEIIGLDYSQFVQVIVLPQGKFEKLLTSNSEDKERILTSIFGEDKWQRIADKLYEDAVSRKDALKQKQNRIETSLRDEDCETVKDLYELIEKTKQDSEELKEEYERAGYEEAINKKQAELNVASKISELKEALEERIKDEEEAIKDAQLADISLSDIQKNIKEHIELEKENEKKKILKIQYEGKTPFYEEISRVEEEVSQKEKNEKVAKAVEKTAKEKYEAFVPVLANQKNEYEMLIREHGILLNRYMSGITGELATQLIEGEACPVCGSLTHPNKAPYSEENVSRQQVDDKKEEADNKYEELKNTSQLQDAAKADYDEKKKLSDKAASDFIAVKASFEEMRKNLVEGIESLDHLRSIIRKLDQEIKQYDVIQKELEEKERSAKEKCAETKAKITAAKKEKEKASTILKEAIEGLSDELPDLEKCNEIIDELNEAIKQYQRKSAVIANEILRLQKKYDGILLEGNGIEEEIRQTDEDYQFAKKLRGDSGTGLQRYVLGIMFSSVVSAANKMLEMVHGGRYRLFRSDDKSQGTNKRGLELKVFDKYSQEHDGRFVSTLSGGEKFLASLALSIGMSTVAQRSGIKIQALFIDEGFGSLDEDSIGDAMNILNSIQQANGLVGIISHVQLLQERIPTKLYVEETEKGSKIKQTVG